MARWEDSAVLMSILSFRMTYLNQCCHLCTTPRFYIPLPTLLT
ncbi:hypothetical protein PS2_044735 [Malus domestica]